MQPTHSTTGERSSKLSGINVLVVEDYPDTLYLFQLILQRYGAHVTPAKDGFEALRIMQSEPIDVLISDIGLPEMNGYELLRRIRANERLRVNLTGKFCMFPLPQSRLSPNRRT